MTDLSRLHLGRRVAALLQPWRGDRPGMTVGIVQDGALALHDSAGLASLELGVPIGAETCFRVASVSKQFTCAAILMLAAEGRVAVDAPVQTYLPDLPEMGEPVTVDHLMHNASGLRDMLEIMRQGGVDLGQVLTTETLLDGIRRQRTLNFTPGTRFLYSNSNFLLLGRIVEAVTGAPLGDMLQQRLFTPLGMTRTRHTPDPRTPIPGLCTGYLPLEGGWARAMHGFPLGGEGGLVSCVEDLALWDRALATGLGLDPAVAKGLHHQHEFPTGVPNLYLRGLRADVHRGVPTVSHGGLWPGYRTEFLRAPDAGVTVIAITNDGGSDPAEFAHRVLDVLIENRPSLHPIPARPAVDAMPGRWVNVDGTAMIEVTQEPDGGLLAIAGGAKVRLEPAADGRMAVTHGTILLALRQSGPDLLEIEQDAGIIGPWHRAPATPALPERLPGAYHSAEMDTTWTIEGATLRVDGPVLRGTTWEIEPIEGDLFRVWVPGALARAWFDVRLLPDGLHVNSNRLKRVRYARVEGWIGGSPSAHSQSNASAASPGGQA